MTNYLAGTVAALAIALIVGGPLAYHHAHAQSQDATTVQAHDDGKHRWGRDRHRGHAEGHHRGPGGPLMRMLGGLDENRVRAMLSFLEADLGITGAQQGSWDAFETAAVAAALDLVTEAKALRELSRSAERPSPPEMLARAETVLTKALEAVRKVRGPMDQLYAELDTAQKARIDEMRDRMRPHRGRHGRD